MKYQNEIFEFINKLLYDMMGEVIPVIDKGKDLLIARKDSQFANYTKDDFKEYSIDRIIIVNYQSIKERKTYRIFIHLVFVEIDGGMPMAYYNVEDNERTLIEKRRLFPEVKESGYYRSWRFVSEEFS